MENKESKTHYNEFDNKQIKRHNKSIDLKMQSCKGTKRTIMQNESSGQHNMHWNEKGKITNRQILLGQKTQTLNLIFWLFFYFN